MSKSQKTTGYVLATVLMAMLLGSALSTSTFSAYADDGHNQTHHNDRHGDNNDHGNNNDHGDHDNHGDHGDHDKHDDKCQHGHKDKYHKHCD